MIPLRFLSCLVWSFLASGCLAKKLVLFAGPHKAASVSVDLFFHNHASSYEDTIFAEGLTGWKWPTVTQDLWMDNGEPMPTTEVLNALVTQANNDAAQTILRQAIEDAWNSAEYGIIVGTAEFDRVGETPYTHYNGLAAMKTMVQELQVPPEDVIVVINYRVPRREQWVSMWNHADGSDHYKKFICKADTQELKELIDTAMNPLKLAVAYRQEGWNVVLIDMGGVHAMQKDIAHVIACDVLENTVCQGGMVIPVLQTYHSNYGGGKDLHSLEDRDQKEMDQLFLERDCYYQPILSNDDKFKILYKDTIWQGCLKGDGGKTQEQIYGPLLDPGLILGALKEQKGCSMGGPKMKNILVGNYESMVVSTIGNTEENGEEGTINNEDGGSEQENGSGGEEDKIEAIQESQNPPTKQGSSSSWIAVLVVAVAGFGVFQLYSRRQKGRDVHFSQVSQDPDHYPNPHYASQEMKVISARDLIDRARHATHAGEPSYWSDPPRSSYSDGDII